MMSYELHILNVEYKPAFSSRVSAEYKRLFGAVNQEVAFLLIFGISKCS